MGTIAQIGAHNRWAQSVCDGNLRETCQTCLRVLALDGRVPEDPRIEYHGHGAHGLVEGLRRHRRERHPREGLGARRERVGLQRALYDGIVPWNECERPAASLLVLARVELPEDELVEGAPVIGLARVGDEGDRVRALKREFDSTCGRNGVATCGEKGCWGFYLSRPLLEAAPVALRIRISLVRDARQLVVLVNVHAVGRVDAEVELIVRPVLCALVTADVVLVDVERHHVLLVLDREAHVADHHAPASQLLSPFELSTRRRKTDKEVDKVEQWGKNGG